MVNESSGGFSVSTRIDASPIWVWKVILSADTLWANAFGEGTRVDSEWRVGSSVLWRDDENNIGASGMVEALHPGELLQIRYHDVAQRDPQTPLGNYRETFTLSSDDAGFTDLLIEVGAVDGLDDGSHRAMWERALQKIKTCAESEAKANDRHRPPWS